MSQPRHLSAIEAISNTVVGYGFAVAAQFAVFPAFGLSVTVSQSLGIAAVFTGLSLARVYHLRRLFERFGSD